MNLNCDERRIFPRREFFVTSMMTVKCAAEIVRELSLHPSSDNILGKSELLKSEDTTASNKTSFSDLAREMELANQQRVAAAAAAAQILSAAAAAAQAAQSNDTDQQNTKNSSSNQSRDLMASVTSKRTPKSKLTFSVDSLLSTKSAAIVGEGSVDDLVNEDSKPEDLSVVTGDEDEEENDDDINVNDDDDNDYLDDDEDEEDRGNSSFSPTGLGDSKHNLPKLAIPTPLLPGSSPHMNGSSPYLAGYLAAVAAANGSSINSVGSQIATSRPPSSAPNPSTAANILSAINRWPSPGGALPPGFPFGGMQNPFLRPGNY